MAKKAKSCKTKEGLKLKIVNPNAAGIDVADGELQVCVPEDRDGDNNRRWGSFTCDLRVISEWLKACRIDTIAMEATGVYWVNVFFYLQSQGFEVILANPASIKNITGKKTDEADAEWIMLLHSYGLIKPSFNPDTMARKVRALSRHRSAMIKSASKEVQHMQKAMELMNIKLSTVISDILGKSGQAIIRAILDGNHDPMSLSQLADPRCKASKETIAKSLEGIWDEEQLFILKQSVELYDYYQTEITECEKKIEEIISKYAAALGNDPERIAMVKKCKGRKNPLSFNIERYAYAIYGVNVMAIPGVNDSLILNSIGELGYDFIKKFDSSRKFNKWLNIVPNNKITGGKLISSKLQKRKNIMGQAFRMSANAVKNQQNEMGRYFRRIKARDGYAQAVVATAHKIATIFYTMIKNQLEYNGNLVGCDEKTILEKKLRRTQQQLDRLKMRQDELDKQPA
jgi:transposase